MRTTSAIPGAGHSGGASVPLPGATARTGDFAPRPAGTQKAGWSRTALAATVVGLLYASVSIYWGVGGKWLLGTVGTSLVQPGRSPGAALTFSLWAAVVLKLAAVALPLMACRRLSGRKADRALWWFSWAEAGILTLYGLVLTTVGLAIELGVVHASKTADHRALAWHAFLWDPWFAVWGLLLTIALWSGRRRAAP